VAFDFLRFLHELDIQFIPAFWRNLN